MAFKLLLDGLSSSLEEEREIIDRLQTLIHDAAITAHTWVTDFHGMGDTDNVIKNATPPEVPIAPTAETGTDDSPADVPPTTETAPEPTA